MLTILVHTGNAYKNHVNIPPFSCWNNDHQEHKCDEDEGDKGTLTHCWQERKLVQPLWQTVWRLLRKTKKRSAIGSSNATPRDIPKGM
jgi:hypothetical protein